jgi:hypothetical protein
MSDYASWKVIEHGKRLCEKCKKGERDYEEREVPGKPGDTTWRLGKCDVCGDPGDGGDKRGGTKVDTSGRLGPAR